VEDPLSSRQVELVVRRSGQPEWRRVLAQGVTQMGRAEDNDLVLPDIGVSRRHARIVVDRDEVRIEDLGSGNGTCCGKVNEQNNQDKRRHFYGHARRERHLLELHANRQRLFGHFERDIEYRKKYCS
jgi:hypothetical protein